MRLITEYIFKLREFPIAAELNNSRHSIFINHVLNDYITLLVLVGVRALVSAEFSRK